MSCPLWSLWTFEFATSVLLGGDGVKTKALELTARRSGHVRRQSREESGAQSPSSLGHHGDKGCCGRGERTVMGEGIAAAKDPWAPGLAPGWRAGLSSGSSAWSPSSPLREVSASDSVSWAVPETEPGASELKAAAPCFAVGRPSRAPSRAGSRPAAASSREGVVRGWRSGRMGS